jgi:hypothetical protein
VASDRAWREHPRRLIQIDVASTVSLTNREIDLSADDLRDQLGEPVI